jgi:uncharacterized protein
MGAILNRLGARMPITPVPEKGFLFGGGIHETGLLISPETIFAWHPLPGASLDESGILQFLEEHASSTGDFVLLGTGPRLAFPSAAFRNSIEKRGLGLDVMDTGAACRTYNVLIAEGSLFTAGLLLT